MVLRDLGAEAMLYDAVADQVVRLNPTSQRIWELCDGERDLAAIASELREGFDVSGDDDLERDVRETVEAFAQAGLLKA